MDVDSLTDGLSSLTPVSPTSSVPPAFPGPEAQGPVPPALPSPDLALASPRSPPAPPGLCHVHTDHAYQVRGWGGGMDGDGGAAAALPVTVTLRPPQPLGAGVAAEL